MQAIGYENTTTTLPNWVPTVHKEQPRGYAYANAGYNIHIYGKGDSLYTISTGLTASQGVSVGPVEDWARKAFGSANPSRMQHAVGEVTTGVWRPGLLTPTEIHQALQTSHYEQRTAEQALRILVEKLDEILLFIEPSPTGLKSYGHKTRELLILACTEIENSWVRYLSLAGHSTGRFTTNHYVRLLGPLHLADYEIAFALFDGLPALRPFLGWSSTSPTATLPWYDAYNKTKHDRATHFSLATLENCLHALAAAIALFCVRYSPFPLIAEQSSLSALVRQHVTIQLRDPDLHSFYVPLISLPSTYTKALICTRASEFVAPWVQIPLVV
ncbi:hypothetical protein [Pandoraea vervacti]|uniref:hypothetical protein n=1 Tax=Pandoraea vervacti TaxID=656178 RepID=UPI0009335CF1|nr:hypothetical protein [Pandoraea vervacti]